MIRNVFAPQWPVRFDTYQSPEAWMFTVGRVVNGVFMQSLRKSVKHPRSLPQTCARVGRTPEESESPTLRTNVVMMRVKEDRFLAVMIYTVTECLAKMTNTMGRKTEDGGTLCLYPDVVKQISGVY
jgi:hypothetical protein